MATCKIVHFQGLAGSVGSTVYFTFAGRPCFRGSNLSCLLSTRTPPARSIVETSTAFSPAMFLFPSLSIGRNKLAGRWCWTKQQSRSLIQPRPRLFQTCALRRCDVGCALLTHGKSKQPPYRTEHADCTESTPPRSIVGAPHRKWNGTAAPFFKAG